MSLMRQCRNGQTYDSRFGHRMRGQGVFAELLAQRFVKRYQRLGFTGEVALDTTAFRPPGAQGELF